MEIEPKQEDPNQLKSEQEIMDELDQELFQSWTIDDFNKMNEKFKTKHELVTSSLLMSLNQNINGIEENKNSDLYTTTEQTDDLLGKREHIDLVYEDKKNQVDNTYKVNKKFIKKMLMCGSCKSTLKNYVDSFNFGHELLDIFLV